MPCYPSSLCHVNYLTFNPKIVNKNGLDGSKSIDEPEKTLTDNETNNNVNPGNTDSPQT